MRCGFCGKDLLHETDFRSLFTFDTPCSDCMGRLSEEPLFSRIPTAAGYLDVIVLYPSSISFEVDMFPFHQKYGIALKQAIISDPEYHIVLFLDAAETERIQEWFPLLAGYPRILILRLADDGFDPFVMFL